MEKTIARLNIAHFRAKLTTEQDEKTRQTLLRLLAEEEAKLVNLGAPPASVNLRGGSVFPLVCAGSK
jgi:hypothetical protein